MEVLEIPQNNLVDDLIVKYTDQNFIEANTISLSLAEIKQSHIIPVFVKDNEVTISQAEFIETAYSVAKEHYNGITLLEPNIRVSHEIKGRIPDARNKAAKELLEHEKTLYYERMAFLIELPEISKNINGNNLSLVIGGVKAYNEDNLYNKKGSSEHFKIFIGFQNKVCLNLCIWTDGLKADIIATNSTDLSRAIYNLIAGFQAERQLEEMSQFVKLSITERQFAQILGKCKMYQYLSAQEKLDLPLLMYGDNQLSAIAKEYYSNSNFRRDHNGTINLWNLFNLYTAANKSSYIDKFLERGLNASNFVSSIGKALLSNSYSWFLE
jgi:hypothetical protein